MNYDFTEQELLFVGGVEKAAESLPKAPASGRTFSAAEIKDALAALAKADYLSVETGKAGKASAIPLMAAMEALSAAAPDLYLSVEMSTRVFGGLLAAHGTGAAKEKVLKPLLAGELLGAVAMSEQAMNVENDPFITQGSEEGGAVVVNGAKNWVINASAADVVAVAGGMGDKAAFFLVPAGAPGLTISEPLPSLGFDKTPISSLTLENVKVDKNMVLGPFDAKAILAEVKAFEDQVLCGAALGAMKAAFSAAKDYAKTHKSGGKPVVAYQMVGFKLSEMLTMYQTSQLLAYRAVWLAEKKDKTAAEVLFCAKVFGSDSAEKVAGGALEVLSGAGYVGENVAQDAYRNAKWTQIAGTSNEIARVKLGDGALGYK
ncbi:MAG: acyl-CoA dehydrogenase [Deltaproteobacteria bacterium]|nr:acyl-CoA dehydrogenase [Deltaproteobacteria bacterium]